MPFLTNSTATMMKRRVQAAVFGAAQNAITVTGQLVDSSNNVLVSYPSLTTTDNANGTGVVQASSQPATRAFATPASAKFQLMTGGVAFHEVTGVSITVSGTSTVVTEIALNKNYSVTVNYSRATITNDFEQTDDWKRRKIQAFLGKTVAAAAMTAQYMAGSTILIPFTSINTSDSGTNATSVTAGTVDGSNNGTPTIMQFLSGGSVKGLIPASAITMTNDQGQTQTDVVAAEKYAISGNGIAITI